MPLPPVPSPRQTLSYLHRLFEGYGLEAKSKLGQNFLIDLNLVDLIVRTAELDKTDAVLEVGTGTGSLTAKLADVAGAVVTVEIDRSLQPVAKEVVGERPNVKFVFGDCLAKKNELNPDMLAAWDEAAKDKGSTRRKLVANLPYVIATPLIGNLLISGIEIERMVVMVQWEIAERMRAEAGTKDYNALSVLVQSIADVETVRKVLPTNFYPRRPKVDLGHRAHPAERGEAGRWSGTWRSSACSWCATCTFTGGRTCARHWSGGRAAGARRRTWTQETLAGTRQIDGTVRKRGPGHRRAPAAGAAAFG